MTTATHLITADDLYRMPGDEGRWCELVQGELIRMSPPGFAHAIVAQNVGGVLREYVNRRRLGRVVAEAGFVLARNPDTVLAPDCAFVRQERIDEVGSPRAFFPEAASLVVEVVSPNDTVNEVAMKMRRWMSAGVELAWVIDPAARTVTVYKSLDDIAVLTEKDTLTGEGVVPGFECRVNDLFTGL